MEMVFLFLFYVLFCRDGWNEKAILDDGIVDGMGFVCKKVILLLLANWCLGRPALI